ncbi:trans-aconitate 2-methyltransferase [Demequina sp. NBRC 110053]|uniref:class I SAM-dependent methyltransferase n=1 Tax=Demequina sp. NBRC 110053 TaxID=1570342 RepID=UPI000A06FC70|nr:class I SAM-dependent methyltransferase [Demequina sp. NBRC 110053]
MTFDADLWAEYNRSQASRSGVRPLLATALEHAGPGAGRVALDLGAGAGIETAALLDAGWSVYAYDADETALAGLRDRLGGARSSRLTTVAADLESAPALPDADLVYSGYTLSWLAPSAFGTVWRAMRLSLREGGVVAVNIFGNRDEWASRPELTCLTETEARALFDGLEILHWSASTFEGESYMGLKRWHLIECVARQ